MTLPLLPVHSAALAASVQPWPLQEFCPLQAEDAVLHALVPLHELTPLHFTLVCPWTAVANAPAAKTATAVATMVFLVMFLSLVESEIEP
jgi:hypothetical protein